MGSDRALDAAPGEADPKFRVYGFRGLGVRVWGLGFGGLGV